jgi:lysophospholipase L1-like esterase
VPPLAALLSILVLFAVSAPTAKAAEAPAYIALGDSLAFGVGVAEPSQEGYVALAFNSLRTSDRYEERGLELLNLSIPGATSADLILEGGQLDAALDEINNRAEDETSSDDNVEIISVNIGGNDLLALAGANSPCTQDTSGEECLAFLGETLSGLQVNLTTTLQRLREAAPQAGIYVLDLYNPFSGTGDFREGLADLAVQQLNGVIGAVTADQELGVRMGDVFQLFRGRGTQWIAGDGLHPNQQGHQVMAEVLLATIDEREPQIPQELLDATPVPVEDPGEIPEIPDTDEGGNDAWMLLAVVIPVAFISGGLITGAYFMARGRA